jgi:phage gpG-like protein
MTPAELAGRLSGLHDALQDEVQSALKLAMQAISTEIAANALSGQVLAARTGTLRASLQAGTDGTTGFISADAPYAAIHEYGGVIDRYSRGQVGRRGLRRGAHAYRIVEPERSYLRPALDNGGDAVAASLGQAIMEVLSS